MTGLWLPAGTRVATGSVTIPRADWERLQRRDWLVGVCKCGHLWIMHYHHGNPGRPGTSCDEYACQDRGKKRCKRYRLRKVRSLSRNRTLR